jgi:hypothetical protein
MRVEPDIAAVAAASVRVESTPAGLPGDTAAFLARFRGDGLVAFNGWIPAEGAVHVHTLRDAVLDVRDCVLMAGDAKLSQSKYLIPDASFDALEMRERDLIGIGTGKAVVIGYNVAYNNYYHWLGQCVPAIAACLRVRGTEGVCIAMPNPGEMQRQCLELLGYGGVELIRLDAIKQYRIRQALFCDSLVGAGSFVRSETAAGVYRRMREGLGAPVPATESIYVARSDAHHRRLLNEAEVIRVAEARGYRVVVPGRMTIREQADCFRRARVVVGPHGAGLTNIAFCQPGTVLYEFVPERYQNPCFRALALMCGVHPLADMFAGGEGQNPTFDPWSVDVERIAARLDEIEDVLARGDGA